MKILTIVGKVDSRPLVYPLARGLSMAGLTGIVTDDGAYRRLFHGKGNMGVVNGVDIAVIHTENLGLFCRGQGCFSVLVFVPSKLPLPVTVTV